MVRYRSGSVIVGIITLLFPLVAAPGATAEEAVSAATLFARAETLYRQLRVVDPQCTDPAAWGTLALAFSEIPERFPTDPMAGEALWRVGDIHSRQMAAGLDLAAEHARAAYGRLISRYPANEHAPDAMLRVAELERPDEARGTYFRLIERYPGSDGAQEARRRLANRGAETVAVNTAATSAAAAEPASPPAAAAEAFETTGKPLDEVLEAAPTPASGTPPRAADLGSRAVVPTATAHVTGVRYYSDRTSTRVVIDMDRAVEYRMGEAKDPPRLFVDLVGAVMQGKLPSTVDVAGIGVQQVRLAVNRPGIVRAVLDLNGRAQYSMFTLTNPNRLVIDVAGPEMSRKLINARRPEVSDGGGEARMLNLGVHRIVIDPGHGGSAPGAIGRTGETEKDLALDISKRLAANLRASNYEVVLTRDSDTDVALEDRPIQAIDADADLFVSIHINSANNRSLSGFETYYLDLATDPTAAGVAARENAAATGGVGHLDDLLDDIVRNANKRESRDLAHSIQDSLVLQTSKSYDGISDLGVKHAPFVVLVGAQMPAVLVECSFLSNPTEEKRLRDDSYRQELADAIHIGIENYAARRRMMGAAR